jgi:hypothetical protein
VLSIKSLSQCIGAQRWGAAEVIEVEMAVNFWHYPGQSRSIRAKSPEHLPGGG